MSFWPWLLIGLIAGTAPSWLAGARLRPWLARRWWRLCFGIAFTCLILPFGIVLLMFLSDSAFEAVGEMGRFFWSDEFRWLTGLTLGGLLGSGLMAWVHRHSPRLQGPPLSDQVTALARDPEKHWQAIQLYRQEAGVGLAVATDVVEGYRARPRGRRQAGDPDRPRLGALAWMYVGFAVAWYVVLGIAFVLSLRSQANHFLTGLALFVFIPSLFGGLCGLCGGVLTARAKAAFQMGLQSGTLTRRYAFSAGLVSGSVSIAGVLAVGCTTYSLSQSEVSVVIALVGVAAVLAASPFLGLWLLHRKSVLP